MAINLMDEISLVLSKKFPNIDVYTDDQEAGFNRPAFGLYIPNMYSTGEFITRGMRNYLVIIKYYPPKVLAGDTYGNMERSKCYQMLEDFEEFLYGSPFEFHTWNKRLKITDDNVLNIKFNAQFRVMYEDADKDFEYMQYLKQFVEVKDEQE